MLKEMIQYCKDLRYTYSNFETGFSRKDVVQGYFADNEQGRTQELLYQNLLNVGFRRTPYQVVFPGQTAGIIRKVKPNIDGMNEVHVRFYDDGVISAELEHGRFTPGHWRKKRDDGSECLERIVD